MNITYNEAAKALNVAINKAKSLAIPVSIAVVDTGGHFLFTNDISWPTTDEIGFVIRQYS